MTAVDLYLVIGQSNAEGRGSSGSSPSVPTGNGFKVVGSTVSHLADPVGGADTGSAWPAFANELYLRRRVPVAIVEAAVSGTPLLPESVVGTTNWSPTGTLTALAITAATDALAALVTAGHTPTLRGFLWHQGETDAQFYPTPNTLAAAYSAALSNLVDRLQASLGNVPMYLARVGQPDSGDSSGFVAVRAGQDSAAANDPDIVMAYTKCVNFPTLGWMTSDLHYSQPGLNDMGTEMGYVVGGALPTISRRRAAAVL